MTFLIYLTLLSWIHSFFFWMRVSLKRTEKISCKPQSIKACKDDLFTSPHESFFKTLSSVNICWTGIFCIYGRVCSTFQRLSIANGNQHNKILFFVSESLQFDFSESLFSNIFKTYHNQRDLLRGTVNKTKNKNKRSQLPCI